MVLNNYKDNYILKIIKNKLWLLNSKNRFSVLNNIKNYYKRYFQNIFFIIVYNLNERTKIEKKYKKQKF